MFHPYGMDAAIEARFEGKGYADFRRELAELVIEGLRPLQSRYRDLTADPTRIESLLAEGAGKIRPIDEVIHERILRRQLDALTQGEGWMPVRSPALSAVEGEVEGLPEDIAEITADLTDLFPALEKVCAEAVRPDDSDLDALLFGLQIENESFELYRELAQATKDPNGKRTYEYLAGAERGHFEWLMLNYEHLSTTDSWAP